MTQYLTIRFPFAKMTYYGKLSTNKQHTLSLSSVFQNTGRAGPALCALARGSWCLGDAAPVTGPAADEYNLNVVDCNTSVTVAHLSSESI